MKGNCNYQPAGLIEYGKTGTGQVLFNIERNDLEVDGEMRENWDFESVEVNNFNRDTIVAAVIRSRYSQDEAEGLLADYAKGVNLMECIRFQNWRDLAKAVGDGKHLKSEVQGFYDRKIIEVKLPFTDTLSGQKYATLADRMLKQGVPKFVDLDNNQVCVYVTYVNESDAQALATDSNVGMTEYSGL